MSDWTKPKQDFPYVTVLERRGHLGPVASIRFTQSEWPAGWQKTMWQLIAAVMIGLPFGLVFWAIKIGVERSGWEAFVYIVMYGAVFMFVMDRIGAAVSVPRELLLDFGADRIQVLKRGKVEIQRPLSGLKNLTVEDHPDAEYKRQMRVEDPALSKALSEEEKSHVLVGWFGTGGAEQVILLTRAEWPNRRSLFEVRQAVFWARERATGKPAEREAGERPSGLNPPLD